MAIAAFEARFARVLLDVDPDVDHSATPYKFSQGENTNKHLPPVLYVSEELAISDWDRTNRDVTGPEAPAVLKWIERPVVIRYSMTMQNARGSHRQVNDRYVVRCKYKIEADNV